MTLTRTTPSAYIDRWQVDGKTVVEVRIDPVLASAVVKTFDPERTYECGSARAAQKCARKYAGAYAQC